MGKIGDLGSDSRPDIVCLEGNGSRLSHRRNGWKESNVMYTLNSTEIHAVCYGIEPGAAKRMNPESRIWKEQAPTLRANAGDNQASVVICYGISSFCSNAMLSGNPTSGIYETNTSKTLDLNGGNPGCNQGGIAVVEAHIT